MSERMKYSGEEWIGDIPEKWDTIRLQWCLNDINVKNDPIQTTQVLSLTIKDGVIPYEEKGNIGNKAKEDVSGYKVAYENTLVINSMNVIIGAVGISKYTGCVSPVYYVFKENQNTDLRFIEYIFKTTEFQKELRKYANGILEIRLRISVGDTLKRRIPCPSYEEQVKIADYLDKKCEKLDAIIEKTRNSVEEYKSLKNAIITAAVTKGINRNTPTKDSGIDWMGDIPEDWSVSRLKYVAKFNPSCTVEVDDDSVITYTPMEYIKNGYYIPNAEIKRNVSSSLTAYQNGDIVMAKVTPCFENGNIAIMDDLESGFGLGSSELFVFRPFDIDTKFLFYWLRNSIFNDRACATMTGTGGLKRVSPYFVQNTEIHIPPKNQQVEIVEYLDLKMKELDMLIEKKMSFVEELELMKKSMIYECVTGKREVE